MWFFLIIKFYNKFLNWPMLPSLVPERLLEIWKKSLLPVNDYYHTVSTYLCSLNNLSWSSINLIHAASAYFKIDRCLCDY